MKRAICLILSVLLLCAAPLGLAGCGAQPGPAATPEQPAEHPEQTGTSQVADLMKGIAAHTPAADVDLTAGSVRLADFAVRLFRAANEEGKNTLVSPLSVMYALAMTANGAREETLAQMETVLGMKAEELNRYLCAYGRSLAGDEFGRLDLANSIWFTQDDSFQVNADFLQTNADYYGADVYQAPFTQETCRAINDWVKEKTRGMIPEILDRIPSEAVMYLVNALAFEAEWVEPYRENAVREGEFTREDGGRDTAEFLYARENSYLETDNATGFIKYYKGGQYAFAALLPREGVTAAELVSSLSGEALHQLLADPEIVPVDTAMPKFETRFSTELSQVLTDMGMPLAFDGDRADFTALGRADENIYISRVLHKTFISVAEQGTRAGAATVVEMAKNTAFMPPEEIKTVCLDRPFVYMLVDCDTQTPFFLGTMMDVNG